MCVCVCVWCVCMCVCVCVCVCVSYLFRKRMLPCWVFGCRQIWPWESMLITFYTFVTSERTSSHNWKCKNYDRRNYSISKHLDKIDSTTWSLEVISSKPWHSLPSLDTIWSKKKSRRSRYRGIGMFKMIIRRGLAATVRELTCSFLFDNSVPDCPGFWLLSRKRWFNKKRMYMISLNETNSVNESTLSTQY